MTPENAHIAVAVLRRAGLGACVIWPHEEVLDFTPTVVTVYDTKAGTLVEKPL